MSDAIRNVYGKASSVPDAITKTIHCAKTKKLLLKSRFWFRRFIYVRSPGGSADCPIELEPFFPALDRSQDTSFVFIWKLLIDIMQKIYMKRSIRYGRFISDGYKPSALASCCTEKKCLDLSYKKRMDWNVFCRNTSFLCWQNTRLFIFIRWINTSLGIITTTKIFRLIWIMKEDCDRT